MKVEKIQIEHVGNYVELRITLNTGIVAFYTGRANVSLLDSITECLDVLYSDAIKTWNVRKFIKTGPLAGLTVTDTYTASHCSMRPGLVKKSSAFCSGFKVLDISCVLHCNTNLGGQ